MKPNEQYDVIIRGVFALCDGYGQFCRLLYRAAVRKGLKVGILPIWMDGNSVQHMDMQMRKAAIPGAWKARTKAYIDCTSIPFDSISSFNDRTKLIAISGKRVLYTMYEADKVHKHIVDVCNKCYDVVAVPSLFNKNVYENSGVKIVHVAPFGIDCSDWNAVERPCAPLRFGMIANAHWGNHRKNYALAYDAFNAAFSGRTDVELLLHTTCGEEICNAPPNVRVTRHKMYKREELQAFYSQINVFMYLTRGEGFGLPPREAMATGCAAVVAHWGALKDLAESCPYVYSVKPRGMISAQLNDTPDYFDGVYADYSVDTVAEELKRIALDANDIQERGAKSAQWLRDNESADNAFDVLYKLSLG